MSFIISNLATDRQKETLTNLGYTGTGRYTVDQLTKEEAAQLIKELFEEQRLENKENICHL